VANSCTHGHMAAHYEAGETDETVQLIPCHPGEDAPVSIFTLKRWFAGFLWLR
jgi:hypothetical protein